MLVGVAVCIGVGRKCELPVFLRTLRDANELVNYYHNHRSLRRICHRHRHHHRHRRRVSQASRWQ